jgi:hypothetical protein
MARKREGWGQEDIIYNPFKIKSELNRRVRPAELALYFVWYGKSGNIFQLQVHKLQVTH